MSPRDLQDRVHDIMDAAREILVFMGGMDFETFRQDVKTIRAMRNRLVHVYFEVDPKLQNPGQGAQ